MSRRAALIWIAILVGAAFACSSSYSGEEAPATATPDDAGGTTPDSAAPADAASDADVAIDAGSDAPADPCDQDRDGFRAATASCGGDDCDDSDSRAHPGDGGFVAAAPGASNGDWNCNGAVERQFASNVTCSDFVPFPGPCSGHAGFTGDPACGAKGTFVTCTYPGNGSACANGVTEMRAQGCR